MAVPYSRYVFGSIPWYGFLIVFGVVLAVFLAAREEKHAGLPKDTVIDLALLIIPAGILGARIYYVVFSFSSFRDNLLSVFYIWQGGLAIYGGIIAGLIAAWVFCKKRNISFPTVADIIAPGLILAQAVGRWGNYFNQEAYGITVQNSSFCFFPFAVLIQEESGPVWHLATFFFESVINLAIFVYLLFARRKTFRYKGDVFCFEIFLYASGRLVIENFRLDSLYSPFGKIRVSQLLSVILCILIITRYYKKLRFIRSISAYPFILLTSYALFSLLVLVFCFDPSVFGMSAVQQSVFLTLYAALGILALFSIYGHSKKEDVLYAFH